MIDESIWKIEWGKGSAWGFGRIKDNPFTSDYRIERFRHPNGKLGFFINSSRMYAEYFDDKEYDSMDDLNEAALGWLRRNW